MKHEVLYKPSYAMLKVDFGTNESLQAEAGALVSMSPEVDVTTSLNAGGKKDRGFIGKIFAFFFSILVAFMRKIVGGESMFVNTFTTSADSSEVLLAPTVTGDIEHHQLNGNTIMVQAGSYLASTSGIELKMKFGGFQAWLSGEGLFFLQCSGEGDLWINSYGGIHIIEVDGEYDVDTGHLVAFEPSLEYQVKTTGGFKSTMLSGEGLSIGFKGTGKVWVQTRKLDGFTGWISPLLPKS